MLVRLMPALQMSEAQAVNDVGSQVIHGLGRKTMVGSFGFHHVKE